jgi:hypothetical protein
MASPDLPSPQTRAGKRWTAEEDDQLHHLIRCGWSVRRIAGVLNRGVFGIYIRALHQFGGIDAIRQGIFAVRTASEVAVLMGMNPEHVRLAIRLGLLRAHRNYGRCGKRSRWLRFLIGDEALEDFIACSDGWMLWTPAQITDRDWRDHAQEVRRRAGRWLSVADVMRRDGVTDRWARHLMRQWKEQGRRVTMVVNRWYVWEEGT